MEAAQETVKVVVEIPKGSRNKYERDPGTGELADEIEHFFNVYNELGGADFRTDGGDHARRPRS